MTLYRVTVETLGRMVRDFDTEAHAKTWADDNVPFEYAPKITPRETESDACFRVCMYCGLILGKIEEGTKSMVEMEMYLSHGICSDCVERFR